MSEDARERLSALARTIADALQVSERLRGARFIQDGNHTGFRMDLQATEQVARRLLEWLNEIEKDYVEDHMT